MKQGRALGDVPSIHDSYLSSKKPRLTEPFLSCVFSSLLHHFSFSFMLIEWMRNQVHVLSPHFVCLSRPWWDRYINQVSSSNARHSDGTVMAQFLEGSTWFNGFRLWQLWQLCVIWRHLISEFLCLQIGPWQRDMAHRVKRCFFCVSLHAQGVSGCTSFLFASKSNSGRFLLMRKRWLPIRSCSAVTYSCGNWPPGCNQRNEKSIGFPWIFIPIWSALHGFADFCTAKGLETHGQSETGATCLTARYSLRFMMFMVSKCSDSFSPDWGHKWINYLAEKLQTKLVEKNLKRSKSELHQTDMGCCFNLVSSVRRVDQSIEGWLNFRLKRWFIVQRCSKHGLKR